MNRLLMRALLAALVCAMTIAPAMAQPSTPFLITGYVSDSDGNPCNDPWVQVTNVNTGASWYAENSSTSNYYLLALESDNVSAGDVLEIEASGCSQSNTTEHTVSQAEIDGGGFSENVTLEPEIISCDSAGNEKDQFAPDETVYAKGTGLSANTEYTIWIQPDPVGDGDTLSTSADPSGSQETVTTDGSGSFGSTAIWSDIPAGSQMNYDIVVDNKDNVYNAASDGIDSATTVGIVAPVPELASITLFAIGLVMLLGLMISRRRD
ncbi:MAG: hypothetical protein U9N07_08190 [Euryarchaeota archaeon]|nr:hypothetical protein [Euryarchaeota archaeon]